MRRVASENILGIEKCASFQGCFEKKKNEKSSTQATHIEREKVSAGDDVDLFILLVKRLENKACNWVHFPFHQIILTI